MRSFLLVDLEMNNTFGVVRKPLLNDTLCSSVAHCQAVYVDAILTIVVNSWTQCTQKTRKFAQ